MQRERPRRNDPPKPKGGIGLTVYLSKEARDLLAIHARASHMSLQGYLRSIVVTNLAVRKRSARRHATIDYLRSLAGRRKSIKSV
jgi:hypothetical protein